MLPNPSKVNPSLNVCSKWIWLPWEFYVWSNILPTTSSNAIRNFETPVSALPCQSNEIFLIRVRDNGNGDGDGKEKPTPSTNPLSNARTQFLQKKSTMNYCTFWKINFKETHLKSCICSTSKYEVDTKKTPGKSDGSGWQTNLCQF